MRFTSHHTQSVRLLGIRDTTKWPFVPALHQELACLQSILIISLLRFTYYLEKEALIDEIESRLPPELLAMILKETDSSARRNRIRTVRALIYKPTRTLPLMDKKAWLISATHTTFMPQLGISDFISEYLVFVHPILNEKDTTWIAVFSRDASVFCGFTMFYISLLYLRWCYMQTFG